MDSTEVAVRDLEAKETAQFVATGQQPCAERLLLQCLLRRARSSSLVSGIAQLSEPPYADPHVRWCGRGGEVTLPPMPIFATKLRVPIPSRSGFLSPHKLPRSLRSRTRESRDSSVLGRS